MANTRPSQDLEFEVELDELLDDQADGVADEGSQRYLNSLKEKGHDRDSLKRLFGAMKYMVPAFLVVGILFLLSILTQSYAAPATAISAPSTALEPTTTKTERVTPTRIQYRVVATYPHDSSYFTEGLEFVSPDTIMESTGLVGQSVLVKYNPTEKETSVMSMAEMGLFGEGATLFADKVWWWSWQTELGYTYDPESLELTGNFSYKGEGWGLTHDDNNLISSDGTDTISFRDDKFAVVRTIKVTENGRAVRNINELEYLGPGTAFNPGSTPAIFANIWQTARLLRISTETGEVDGFLDLKSTWDQEMQQASVDVPNGIATDSQGRLWVTGKFWNNFYVLEPAASNSSSPTSSATSSSSVATTTAKPAAGGRLSARTGLLTGAGAIAMVAILML